MNINKVDRVVFPLWIVKFSLTYFKSIGLQSFLKYLVSSVGLLLVWAVETPLEPCFHICLWKKYSARRVLKTSIPLHLSRFCKTFLLYRAVVIFSLLGNVLQFGFVGLLLVLRLFFCPNDANVTNNTIAYSTGIWSILVDNSVKPYWDAWVPDTSKLFCQFFSNPLWYSVINLCSLTMQICKTEKSIRCLFFSVALYPLKLTVNCC